MTFPFKKVNLSADFRIATTLGVAIAGLVFMTPFSVNNFVQGRYLLGFGSTVIVVTLAMSAWSTGRGRYHPWWTFIGLVPAVIFFLVVAFREQMIIGALWCYPAVIAFYCTLPERKAWFANVALVCIALPQAWLVLDHAVAIRVTVTLVVVSTFTAILVRIITNQQRRLQEQALTDSLTGLANRATLSVTLEHAVEQSRRSGTPMTLLALDLDHFKRINDSLGHDAGDTVLQNVGQLIGKRIRRADKAFRLGGEEFLVLLYGTDLDQGCQVAEDIRRAVEKQTIFPGTTVSVSVGAAGLKAHEDWQQWMKRSDERLLRAKTEGRNRVIA